MSWSSPSRSLRAIPHGVAGVALVALAAPASAAERRATIAATGGLSVADNPYLSTQSNVSALLAEFALHPKLSSKTEVSAVELSGTLGHRRYSAGLGSYLYGNGLLSASVRRSERLALSGSAHYRHEISTDSVEDTAGAVDPRSIRRAMGGRASAVWQVSELSSLSPSFSAERVSYDRSDELLRHDQVTAGLGFTRRLSPTTSLGLAGNAMAIMYRGQPDAQVVSANATVSYRLSERFTVNGALGLERSSFTAGEGLEADRQSKLFVSGNGQICRRSEYSSLCAVASAASSPSGRGSIERRLSGGVSYGHRLGEFSNLSLGLNYQRSTALSQTGEGRVEMLQASASFDKKLTDFLTVDTFLKYRRRGGLESARSAQAGINLRIKTGRQ